MNHKRKASMLAGIEKRACTAIEGRHEQRELHGPIGLFDPRWPDKFAMLALLFAYLGATPDILTIGVLTLYGFYLWLLCRGG